MKAIQELLLPEEAVYTDDHEWALQVGEQCTVGITDYAQDQLGDIVFVELPGVGERFKQGDVFGTVESVKAVAELFMPVS
ncbi:MAG: glycine cleavage system protein H, partial [Deltaproteobacteria bacterium]|nr:glycine cleavage system protein H [Deltaproteobacteria bacterium]